MELKIIIVVVVVAVIAGMIARGNASKRRSADATPGLHEHPERLEQNLDSSDDA